MKFKDWLFIIITLVISSIILTIATENVSEINWLLIISIIGILYMFDYGMSTKAEVNILRLKLKSYTDIVDAFDKMNKECE